MNMEHTPQKFHNALLEHYPSIWSRKEFLEHHFANIVYKAISGNLRPHWSQVGEFILSKTYLEKYFGNARTFHRMNDDAGIFQFDPNYRFRIGAYARAVDFIPEVRGDLVKMLLSDADTPSYLIDNRGRRVVTERAAILTHDKSGGISKAYRSSIQLQSSMVRVNRSELRGLYLYLEQERELILNGAATRIERIRDHSQDKQIAWLRRASCQARSLLYSSRIIGLQDESLMHQYIELESGRLLGLGNHLQGTIREVRRSALGGQWDHDINSCHFQLTHGLAQRYGYEAGAVREYTLNKRDILGRIAREANVERWECKKLLLALIYGATLSPYWGSTITEVLGDRADDFRNHPLVAALAKDVNAASKLILARTNFEGNKFRNAIGKPVNVNGKDKKQLLANILQGYESLALHIAIRQLDGNITLLCHDGFVTQERIDTYPIVAEFERISGGLEIGYKSEQLIPITQSALPLPEAA